MSLNDRISQIAAEQSAAKDSIGEAAVKNIILTYLARVPCENRPKLERNYLFARELGRKFELDFAWPELYLAIEVQGAPGSGRHTSREGYTEDCVKRNLLLRLGWRVAEFTTEQVMEDYQNGTDGRYPVCRPMRVTVQGFLEQFLVSELLARR